MWTQKNVYLLKLGKNLPEIELWTFERIQRVIWDHLLPFKGEIIQKQALFSFRWIIIALYYPVCSVFSFVLFSSPPSLSFRLNHGRKVRKRCSHSRFSSEAIMLQFFDRNVRLCCSCFLVAVGDCGNFVESSNEGRQKKILNNSGFLPFRWNLNKIKPDC